MKTFLEGNQKGIKCNKTEQNLEEVFIQSYDVNNFDIRKNVCSKAREYDNKM